MRNDGWKPIETAPRDGTAILAYASRAAAEGKLERSQGMKVTWWRSNRERDGFTGWGEFNDAFWPATHWMPLPKPPTDK